MVDSAPERIRISLKAQYALKALFDLATQPPNQPIRIAGVAKRQQIPQKFLETILAGLKQGGFVESRRGVEGGYLLAMPPEAITVGAVVRFLEGRGTRSRGKRPGADPFDGLWRQLDEAFAAVLDNTSFAELVRTWQEHKKKYVPTWDI
jgi:Rrf2 family transcriptional regulator, cysteine metabolism repressor